MSVENEPAFAQHFVEIDGHPFLPIAAFRQCRVFTGDVALRRFQSSGSTNEKAAEHWFSAAGLAAYQRASSEAFGAFLTRLGLSSSVPILSLVPPVSVWPNSSLAAMIEMFKTEGFQVVYEANRLDSGDDLVIFGTSLHHVLMAQHRPQELARVVRNRRVFVIDTGGTKGKTFHYSFGAIRGLIAATYHDAKDCTVVSEYGMCELSSQAWSLEAPHDGWFQANPLLTPLVVDLDRRCKVKSGEMGFLAFIDANNHDSYPAIITEDLAVMSDTRPNCFKLVGRAPDASLKGCSLRVSKDFVSLSKTQKAPVALSAEGAGTLSECIAQLPNAVWDEWARKDLALSLASLECSLASVKTRERTRMLMVLSANIPITFLYPAVMAQLRGVAELHLQMPSLRPNDPLSDRVREQIRSLAQALAPALAPMRVFVHDETSLDFEACRAFDAVLLFGSDETVSVFKQALPGVELIAFGTVTNGLKLSDSDTPQAIASHCARWLGRGCLTPLALVGENDAFARDFGPALDAEMSARLQSAGVDHRFFHRHRLLELERQLKAEGLDPTERIWRGQSAFVIDLRGTCLKPDWKAAGCGLVFLLSEVNDTLSFEDPCPSFDTPHMGRYWHEWI